MREVSSICQCSRSGSEYKRQCLVQSLCFKRLEVECDGPHVSNSSHKYHWIYGRDMRSVKFIKLQICLEVTVNIPWNNYFFLRMEAGDYLETSVLSYHNTWFHIPEDEGTFLCSAVLLYQFPRVVEVMRMLTLEDSSRYKKTLMWSDHLPIAKREHYHVWHIELSF